jgi:AcrR family transcriptional regulator
VLPTDAASPDAPPRRERADARRNRARILAAARELFASEGPTCQIDQIARRAGVGTGTMYRNFPTKQALLEALVVDGVQQHVADARALADAADPTAAFFTYLAGMVEKSRAHKAFSETLASAGIDVQAAKAEAANELHHVVGQLLRRAQEAGGVRPDVRVPDLMALLAGTCHAAAHSEGDSVWLARVVCDGLRPVAARTTG